MFCMNCGAGVKQGSQFCPSCGKSLQKTYKNVVNQHPTIAIPQKNNTWFLVKLISLFTGFCLASVTLPLMKQTVYYAGFPTDADPYWYLAFSEIINNLHNRIHDNLTMSEQRVLALILISFAFFILASVHALLGIKSKYKKIWSSILSMVLFELFAISYMIFQNNASQELIDTSYFRTAPSALGWVMFIIPVINIFLLVYLYFHRQDIYTQETSKSKHCLLDTLNFLFTGFCLTSIALPLVKNIVYSYQTPSVIDYYNYEAFSFYINNLHRYFPTLTKDIPLLFFIEIFTFILFILAAVFAILGIKKRARIVWPSILSMILFEAFSLSYVVFHRYTLNKLDNDFRTPTVFGYLMFIIPIINILLLTYLHFRKKHL